MANRDLTDEQFRVLEPLLPPERSGRAGCPYRSHRQVLNGILWMLRTGASWRDLPECYGPWSTVYSRFRRWCREGVFQCLLDALQARARKLGRIDFSFGALDSSSVRAHKAAAGARREQHGVRLDPEASLLLQALGRSRGGFGSKIHVLCEGAGKPITLTVTPGQQHDNTQVEPLLDRVCIRGKPGRPRSRFKKVAGDKAFDSRGTRRAIRRRGGRPVIAHRRNRQGQYPASARDFDKESYRQRNVVERLIARLKEFRRIATRYEKLATHFVGMLLLGCIHIWAKDLLSYTA